MHLKLRSRNLDLSVPLVMGVLNRTPDSFSDGGYHFDLDAALHGAERMLAEGAALIDIGGESTRPGAVAVTEQEEMDRVLPLIERLHDHFDCVLSVDTMKPAVMLAACKAGAELINDVHALRTPGALQAAVSTGAGVCLMHMQGTPRTMQQAPRYGNVVSEVTGFLEQQVSRCEQAGIVRERLCIDPGFGFGKNLQHSLVLLGKLEALSVLGLPVLVGLSRKSLLGAVSGRAMADRVAAGSAAAALAVDRGALIVRSHDVAATVDAVRLGWAVRQARVPLSTSAQKMEARG